MATLHVLNGDAPRSRIESLGLEGEILVWREALSAGPLDASAELDEHLETRARHLAEAYGENQLEARRDLGRMEARLTALGPGDHVVLWFEDDLYCHVHLWYVLARLADGVPASLICGPELLGEQSEVDLARLFRERRLVTDADRRWSRTTWHAFGGPDPRGLEEQGRREAPLPFGPTAIRLHLERFPALGDGLGRIERRVLAYLASGIDRFGDVFRRLLAEESGLGFGDAQIFLVAHELAAGDRPLIGIHGATSATPSGQELRRVSFSITDDGRAALAGELDAARLCSVDRWLGGTRLPPRRAPFRWSRDDRCIVAASE